MADKESKENDPPRGNEWEVVTLTASAYAAAPGPERADPAEEEDSVGKLDAKNEAETSSAMFMSKHFVFPPSQHENLPLEPEYNEETHSEKGTDEDYVSQLVKEEGVKPDIAKDEENATFEGLISEEFPGIPVFDDKGNSLSDVALGNAQSMYGSDEFRSFRSEATIGMSTNAVQGEETDDSVEPYDSSALQDSQKSVEGDEHDGVGLPCEAWWKRRAFSLYAHAKEANTLWSVFIAAAVMGLVIIGHQWQQERWKVLHLKYDEKMNRMVGPISRFKDLIVGGHRRGSLVRGASSAER